MSAFRFIAGGKLLKVIKFLFFMKNRKKNKNHYCLFYTCKQKAWNKLRKSFLAQTRRLNDGNDKSGIKTELWAVGPRNERTRRREKKSAKRSEAVRRFLAAIIGVPVTIGRSTETDVTSTSAQFAWRCGIAPLTPPLHSFPPPLILIGFEFSN